MRGLLSLSRCLGSKRGGRRVPRSLQGLPTPNMRRSWGNMENLSPQEKEELLKGAWRASKPIQLVADKTDRDGGGFAEPVTFHSEEEAQKFLAEEDADDAAELRESTLALAQRFFVELATAADEELDASQLPPAPQSDEERRREMRDVQRQFFADFYVEQGLVSEAERYAFVDALLRPSRALFLVNTTLPLVRLTVRDQLESDVPTQSIGAPLYVPYTAATTLVGPPESSSNPATGLLGGKQLEQGERAQPSTAPLETATIDDADALDAMLLCGYTASDNDVRTSREGNANESEDSVCARRPDGATTSFRPPTLDHTYWLQRQVASNTLLNVDLLSHAISLLSVHLAAAASHGASTEAESSYVVILYHADTTTERSFRRTAAMTYHTEIAQYLFRSAQEAGQDSDVVDRLNNVVVAVEDATFTPSKRPNSRRHGLGEEAALALVDLSDASDVPVVDRYPNVVYVTHCEQQRRRRSTSSTVASQMRSKFRAPLCGRVVVCAPTTSQDGVRPRGWLSGGEGGDVADGYGSISSRNDDNEVVPDGGAADKSPARIFSVPSPNNFVDRCQLANENFTRLQQCLYSAIRAVDVGSSRCGSLSDGGWVIYATQSMNVVENEAVVCAVLQRLDAERRQMETTSTLSGSRERAVASLHVECVPIASARMERYFSHSDAAIEGARLLCNEGRPGFCTWVAIEGGSAAQEVEQYPLALRTAVAQAIWRTDPVRNGDDGGCLICLRVSANGAAPTTAQDTPQPRTTEKAAPPSPLRWWTHPRSRATSAVTPALLRFLEAAVPPKSAERNGQAVAPYHCSVLHAGVPVGFLPSSQLLGGATPEHLVTTCSLSGATAHVDVLAALKDALPVLRLSALAFSELLLAREVSSRGVRRQLHLRSKQLPALLHNDSGNGPDDQNVVVRESLAFLAAVEDLIGERENNISSRSTTASTNAFSRKRFSLLVEADPESFLPPVNPNGATSPNRVLDPAVVEELQVAGVVAQLEYAPQPGGKASALLTGLSNARCNSLLHDFTLRLDICANMPERAKHLAALEEWRVALRDALLYVYRRTGAAATTDPRLWTATAGHPSESEAEWDVRLPRGDEERLELAEDEYETVADAPRRTARRSVQVVAPPPGFVGQESVAPSYEKRDGSDWLEGTNYWKWRRRRSQR